jgi:hypothetical protein
MFGADHKIPKATLPEDDPRRSSYEHLLYACNRCNFTRQAADSTAERSSSARSLTPPIDPDEEGIGNHLSVRPSGEVEAESPRGEKFIETFRLNHPDLVDERSRYIELADALEELRDEDKRRKLEEFFGFPGPENLPELDRLRPPHNDSPQGVEASALEKYRKGTLPEIY